MLRSFARISDNFITSRRIFLDFRTIKRSFKSSLLSHQSMEPTLKTWKIDSQEFHAIFTPELKKLIEIFKKHNYELRLAGGAARDLLMDKMPGDLDFATTATPGEMKEMFELENIRMLNMGGEKHGTITARINDKENFEVTTLRIDIRTDGRHAEVEWTKDWALDALRRDLTINSMFLGFDGTLYDYFCGREDLENRRLRFVGSAADRIQEDYLRILRYFRFFGRIAKSEYDHENDTLRAIKENAHGLEGIAGERIWVEVKKTLTGNHVPGIFKVMLDLGIGNYIGLPGEFDLEELRRVWVACHDLDPLPLTLLPALMQTTDQVVTLHKRVKMSRDEQQLGHFIIDQRDTSVEGDYFSHCQDLWCEHTSSVNKVHNKICELLKYWNQRETLKRFADWTPPKFPVSGVTLLELGVPKGPQLAKKLNFLKKKWQQSRYTASEEELVKFLKDENK